MIGALIHHAQTKPTWTQAKRNKAHLDLRFRRPELGNGRTKLGAGRSRFSCSSFSSISYGASPPFRPPYFCVSSWVRPPLPSLRAWSSAFVSFPPILVSLQYWWPCVCRLSSSSYHECMGAMHGSVFRIQNGQSSSLLKCCFWSALKPSPRYSWQLPPSPLMHGPS